MIVSDAAPAASSTTSSEIRLTDRNWQTADMLSLACDRAMHRGTTPSAAARVAKCDTKEARDLLELLVRRGRIESRGTGARTRYYKKGHAA